MLFIALIMRFLSILQQFHSNAEPLTDDFWDLSASKVFCGSQVLLYSHRLFRFNKLLLSKSNSIDWSYSVAHQPSSTLNVITTVNMKQYDFSKPQP